MCLKILVPVSYICIAAAVTRVDFPSRALDFWGGMRCHPFGETYQAPDLKISFSRAHFGELTVVLRGRVRRLRAQSSANNNLPSSEQTV